MNVPTWTSLHQYSSLGVPVVSSGPGAAALVERLPVAILTVDGAARVQYANEQAARLLGSTRHSLVGRALTQASVAPEHHGRFASALHAALGGDPATVVVQLQSVRRLVSIHVLPSDPVGFAHLVLFDLTEQHEVEAALQQSETLYDTFLEQSPIGLVHLDATGTVTFENHRFRQIVGERPEDAWIGLSAFRLPGLDGLFVGAIKRLLNAQQVQDYAVQYQPPGGGALRHLLLSGSPIRRASGTVSGAVLMVQDVTEERQRAQEEALRARFERAEAALREAVLAGDDATAFLRDAARIFAQTTGADRAALLLPHAVYPGQLRAQAVWGEQADVLTALRLDPATTSLPDLARVPLVHLSTSEGAAHAPFTDAAVSRLVSLHAEGHFEGVLLLDWFEGNAAASTPHEALLLHLARLFETLWSWLRTTQRFRLTVSTMTDALANFVFAPAGERRFLFVTPQVEALTGRPVEAFLETPGTWSHLPLDAEARDALEAHERRLHAGQQSTVTFRLALPGGDLRWLREHAAPHDDGDVRSFIAILSDVTEQKRAEQVLRDTTRHAEAASRDKTAFIATLSHEIRTPLGTIHGFAELLSRELDEYQQQTGTPLPPQIEEFVATIRERSEQTLSLVRDIFDLANLEAGVVQVTPIPTDVNDLVTHVVSRYAPVLSGRGVVLHLDLDPSGPRVLADAQRLEQIVDHLVSNAVKFTPEGSVSVRTRRAAGAVEIDVLDSGVGMSEAFQEKLFTPFLQEDQRLNRDYEGMGLGLALVRRLVELLGGRIGVTSRKGEGATFRVSLPLAQD